MTTPSDGDLVAAARDGDVDAFEQLYRRYRDWVVRLARARTGSAEDALDVLQETFTYVHRKLPTLQLRARFTTFLYPVVVNLSRMRQRQARRRPVALEDEPPAREDPADRLADLIQVVGGLPTGQRDVVLLRFVDGLSMAEIAAALHIPAGTVKSRLHLALRTLRDDPGTRAYFLDDAE